MARFEFITTHALSILVVLMIFIFLFQRSVFETMIHSFLGRLTLLFILILVASHNTVLGLVGVLLIVLLYEYDNTYEGNANMSDFLSTDVASNLKNTPTEVVEPDNSGAKSKPAVVPTNEPETKSAPPPPDSISKSQKTDLESQIQKGKSSKHFDNPTTTPAATDTTTNVNASESTTTTDESAKQGFTNMFGNGYSLF
jgi:hypothetical protein